MSLLALIPLAWIVIGAILLVLCRGAKDGDEVLDEAIEPARRKAAMSGVVILKDTSSMLIGDSHGEPGETEPEAQRGARERFESDPGGDPDPHAQHTALSSAGRDRLLTR